MQYEDNARTFNFVVGLLFGMAVGAGVALLLAPQSGRRTRRKVASAVAGAREDLGERWDEWTSDVRSAIESGRRRFRM